MAKNPSQAIATKSNKAPTKTNYDRLSRWYDFIAGKSERWFREKGLDLLNVESGERVLEVGCGTGESLVTLVKAAGSTGLVYGLDLSDGMLDQARKRLIRNDLFSQALIQRADATSLPFPERSFDAVFMSFTLELFETSGIIKVLSECWRVLLPGGRICVVSLAKGQGMVVNTYKRLHDLFPAIIDCRPISARDFLVEAGLHFIEAEQLSMWGLPVDVVLVRKS